MAQAKVLETTKIKTPMKSPTKQKKPQVVSYEIPDSFNPFATGERILRVEEGLKHQRELMQQGFAMMDKRFEAMDKRFEDMQKNADKRFEDMQKNMDKRFDAVDKRFEDMQKNMDKRFEEMQNNTDKRFEETQKNTDKRFAMMIWVMSGGFSAVFGALLFLINQAR